MLSVADKPLLFNLEGYGFGKKCNIALKDIKTRYVVVFFYPKDNTPGCIREAVAFSLMNKQFEQLDVTILGVSRDSIDVHKKFIDHYALNIILLSDVDLEVSKYYGVWQEQELFKSKSNAISRSTFIIDLKEEKILETWKVGRNAGQHPNKVFNWVKENISKS